MDVLASSMLMLTYYRTTKDKVGACSFERSRDASTICSSFGNPQFSHISASFRIVSAHNLSARMRSYSRTQRLVICIAPNASAVINPWVEAISEWVTNPF